MAPPGRVRINAEELIKSCNDYLEKTTQPVTKRQKKHGTYIHNLHNYCQSVFGFFLTFFELCVNKILKLLPPLL